MTTKVWYLLFNDKKEVLHMPLKAEVQDIYDLKEAAKRGGEGVFPYLEKITILSFVVWQCKRPKWLTDQSNEELRYNLSTVDFLDERHVVKLEDRTKVLNLKLDEDEILLVQVPRYTSKRKFKDDEDNAHSELKRAKLVTTAPSDISKAHAYRELQSNDDQKILDDRSSSPDNNIPPIALLYHGFGYFLDVCRGEKNVPGTEKVDWKVLKESVDAFADAMVLTYGHEDDRRVAALSAMNQVFRLSHANFHAANIGVSCSDGHIIGPHKSAVSIVEVKNEVSGTGSIPIVKAVACVARTQSKMLNDVFCGWRVPCLGITIVGPDIAFHAIVAIRHQYRVIPLTPALSCILGASDGRGRKMMYSAFLAALVLLGCIWDDGARYTKCPPPAIPFGQHKFPAITQLPRYKESGEPLSFQIKCLYPDRQHYRWLYAAETADKKIILVKFTRHYSIELHYFCAQRRLSPRILGFERLPGGWFCVATEYLSDACPLYMTDLLQSHMEHWEKLLRELVLAFHQDGFVHGDLRAANIICKGDKVFLIGFDWAGKAGKALYPIDLDHLNPDLLKGRTSSDKVITVDDDDRVLDAALKQIRQSLQE